MPLILQLELPDSIIQGLMIAAQANRFTLAEFVEDILYGFADAQGVTMIRPEGPDRIMLGGTWIDAQAESEADFEAFLAEKAAFEGTTPPTLPREPE